MKRAVLNLSMKIVYAILLMAAIGMVFAADAAAQAQMGDKKSAGTGKIEVLWLGQSATRITTVTGKVIVIDPFLTQNPKTPPQYKNLDALGKVDLILVTHAHGDHLGDGVELAKENQAPRNGLARSITADAWPLAARTRAADEQGRHHHTSGS